MLGWNNEDLVRHQHQPSLGDTAISDHRHQQPLNLPSLLYYALVWVVHEGRHTTGHYLNLSAVHPLPGVTNLCDVTL